MIANQGKAPELVAVDFDPFAQGEVVTMAPATAAQREIWASVQMEPAASLAYNESLSLRLRGPLEVERLRVAFRRVLERHGSLRATFTPDGVWLCISSALPTSLALVDLSTLSAADQAQGLAEQARLEVETPLDLVHGPLVRAQLFRLSSEEHVLFFTAHHIVCDGWSHWVVMTELAALYSGQELPEPDSFARYASDDVDGQKDEAYWLQRFANGVPTLDLPEDRPRPRQRSYDSAREDLVLPQSLVEGLQKLGARHGASLVATFLAGYAAFLHRLTGQEDLVIGVPAAGQARTGQDHLVGHCISLLPVRLAVAPEQPFAELLRSVRTTFLDALDHQRPSFGRLLESLRLARDPARIPLVSTVLNMDRSAEKLDFQGLEVSYASHPRRYETFELFINASVGTGRFVLAAQYNANLFEAATIRRRLRELQTLLAGAVADPERKVAQLPLLPDEERQRILVDFNRTEVDYRPPSSLHQLFERQADATPDRIAVVSQGQSLTYRELEERANQLAHRLRVLGVAPNTCVAVCAERSLEMVIAIYGVLKAGAAYLPLEPSDPLDRLAYFLGDAKPVSIVAQAAVVDRLPDLSVPVVAIGPDSRGLLEAPTTRPACLTSGHDLAYIIYTSGSTGRPKGVGNLHKGILNRILWTAERFGSAADQRVLQKTPFTFDVSLWELFWPLAGGGTLVMAPPRAHQDPARLAQVIAESRITMMHFVPSMLHAFLEHADLEACGSVQRVLCSGEVLPYDLQERFFQRWGGELHNLYGPTEAAVDVTHWACVPGDPRGIVPIGRALANTWLYVVDREGQPTPIGVPGELLIGGVQVARGYLGRPELTAQRFVADPFSARPGDRVYRTGDRARFLEGGEIEFLGRLDDQVKVRGLRIEPGEIEAVLAEHPAVRQAVLRVFEPKAGDVRLAAFYVPAPGAEVSAADLRKHLRSKLPEYMIPQQFIVVERMPLTSSGKIDRKALALPAASEANVVASGETVGPRNPTEESIAAIWTELLSTGKIGIHDNFFELGGHSLLAIKAMSRIRDVFKLELPLQRLFENPTVAGLAAVVMEAKGTAEAVRPIEPRQQTGPCPLSFAQEQFWLLDQTVPGSPAYNIMDVIAIDGEYHASALKSALDELVRRHEVLRTAFILSDGQLLQTVLPASDLPLPELDLSALPEPERARAWTRLVREEGQKAFDLSQYPLLRATVVHYSEHEHKLLLTIHHIVADEWAMGLIQDEVKQLYAAFSQKRPSPLAQLAVQYADFAYWQRDWFRGEKLDEQIAYWKKELEGVSPVLALPTDKPRPAALTFRGATEHFALPKALLPGLRALGRKEQATLFMVLEAAFVALLHRCSGQADILVGTPISGRTQSETQRLVGCFLNTVVLRSQFTPGHTFRALLQQVRTRALGAFAHAELPFGRLVATVAPERDASRTPLFQVMFVLHDPDGVARVLFGHPELETGTSKFDLTLYVSATDDGIEGLMEYSTDLFEADTVGRLCRHFGVLLEAIVRDPDQSISGLPMLTEADRQQLLVEWNRTEADYPRELPLAELVEAQVERTPDAVALVWGSQSLSFAEFNARANQLAYELWRSRCRTGPLAGHLCGALARHGGRAPGRGQGRGGLPAARPAAAARAAQLHARGQRGIVGGDPRESAGLAAGVRWHRGFARRAELEIQPTRQPGRGGAAGPSRLCYLYLGFDGQAEGGRGAARSAYQSTLVDARLARADRRGSAARGHHHLVRHRRGGYVAAPFGRGAPGGGESGGGRRRDAPARADRSARYHLPAGHPGHLASLAAGGLERESRPSDRVHGRGHAAGFGGRAGAHGAPPVEPVRTHGDHHLVDRVSGTRRRPAGPHRPANSQHAMLYPRQEWPSGPHWSGRRAVHRGRWVGPGLSAPSRADRREIPS